MLKFKHHPDLQNTFTTVTGQFKYNLTLSKEVRTKLDVIAFQYGYRKNCQANASALAIRILLVALDELERTKNIPKRPEIRRNSYYPTKDDMAILAVSLQGIDDRESMLNGEYITGWNGVQLADNLHGRLMAQAVRWRFMTYKDTEYMEKTDANCRSVLVKKSPARNGTGCGMLGFLSFLVTEGVNLIWGEGTFCRSEASFMKEMANTAKRRQQVRLRTKQAK